MRKIISNQSLDEIIPIPNSHLLTKSDIRYHGSLIPKLEVLKQVNYIDFEITYKTNNLLTGKELGHQNPVNNHIFKPKYYRKTKDHLICKVASREMLTHTIRSIALMNLKYVGNIIIINAIDREESYGDFCKKEKIYSHIFIGRVESVVNYLRMKWLFENTSIKKSYIKGLFRKMELNRLKNKGENGYDKLEKKYLASKNLSFKKIDKNLKLKRYESQSIYIEMVNVVVDDTPISVIQLPWGYSMSIEMMSYLINQKNKVKRIGIVGGVGYIGEENINIDDVFEPKNLIIKTGNKLSTIPINNDVFNLPSKKYFFNKKAVSGNIYSVVPQVGKISYTTEIRNAEWIHAYDMEKEAFINAIGNSNVTIASSYYIMDFPYTKLDLGGTYYNYSYVKKLFSKKNRGKYFCFERVIHFLTTK